MPLPSVTYETYQQLGGKLGEKAFTVSLRAATSAVRDVIGYNEPQDADDEEAYVRAVCAAVEVDSFYGATGGIGEGASSVSLGKFSMSGGTGVSSYDADMARTIKRELIGSSLLYQGIS